MVLLGGYMGFFDKLLQGLGFESSGEKVQENVKKKKEKKQVEFVEEVSSVAENLEEKTDVSSSGAEFEELAEKDVEIAEEIISRPQKRKRKVEKFYPQTQAEVEEVLLRFKTHCNVIINLSAFNQSDILRALDFIAGYAKCLDAKVKKISDEAFLLELK